MKNEIDVRLCFWEFEDLPPEAITEMLGVEPTKVMRQGEPRGPKGLRVWPYNGWVWEASADKSVPFEDQCTTVLDLLVAHRDAVLSFCHRCTPELSCALRVYVDNGESTPSVHLNTRYHALASEFNLSFDLDLYCMPNGEAQA
ncbi:DUF4279 domain-containing protein [Hymenobacter sp. 5317J-9]|uniref:DUF4279 domain-containing protein n=1 Tax=Hymenobacter sp. 5317J-9 TaxID=2932250 RepID=UPI001FD6C193|nr:DUF4279 domain-containing protein [Hymenobacter sp. 5317J-9]UOQ97346.1 DUF4279 domain-containing protein [Hymenobacter sp. 5317J-9]